VTKTSGVLVAGSINTDLVVHLQRSPGPGETVTGQSFVIFGGGKGANQTLASARSGARTAILGAVGDDDFGRQRLADLVEDRVNIDSVAKSESAPSGVALIFVEPSGENRIAYVPGATMTVTPDQAVEAFTRFQPAVVLTTLELLHESLEALFDTATKAGSTVIVNATPEPAQGKYVVGLADVLIANETEACELLDVPAGDHDWGDLAGKLLQMGPRAVLITMGAVGAILQTSEVTHRLPAPEVKVVDTTGAGDAFCGALAAAISRNCSLLEAAKIGVAAGAVAVTKPGAQPSMPTLAEIDLLVSKQ
jgi:ribokinase